MEASPLVILGFDAGDPDLLMKWAQEGYLPTVASLMERGCWGRTAGPELVSEHGVWVSLFSGISRGQHGYFYFRALKPNTYDLTPTTAASLELHPFWASFRGTRHRVALIDLPDCELVEGLAGLQLANWDVHNSQDPEGHPAASRPPALLEEVIQAFGPPRKPLEDLDSTVADDLKHLEELHRRILSKGALCRKLLTSDPFDLIAVVFAESHAASHQFWSYHCDGLNGHSPEAAPLKQALRGIYQAIDREMGLLLEALPASSTVCILSSVGMMDDYPTSGLGEAFCRTLGYQAAPAPGGRTLKPLDLARRFLPESWRVALSQCLSRTQRERLLADQFRNGTDWHNTTAFALPSIYTSFIRVNMKGREPMGTVAPGAAYEALLDRLEADLKRLVDPETNLPAVTHIARTQALFPDPHPGLPDLFVDWQPGRFMQRVVHPRAELTQARPAFFRRSDHSSEGFFALGGPSVRQRGEVGEIDALDLAPTFLSLMRYPVPAEMTGTPLHRTIP